MVEAYVELHAVEIVSLSEGPKSWSGSGVGEGGEGAGGGAGGGGR